MNMSWNFRLALSAQVLCLFTSVKIKVRKGFYKFNKTRKQLID